MTNDKETIQDFLITIGTTFLMIVVVFFICSSIFVFSGCSSNKNIQTFIPTPTKCDYNLTIADINTSTDLKVLESASNVIYTYDKIQKDLRDIPCLNITEGSK